MQMPFQACHIMKTSKRHYNEQNHLHSSANANKLEWSNKATRGRWRNSTNTRQNCGNGKEAIFHDENGILMYNDIHEQ